MWSYLNKGKENSKVNQHNLKVALKVCLLSRVQITANKENLKTCVFLLAS